MFNIYLEIFSHFITELASFLCVSHFICHYPSLQITIWWVCKIFHILIFHIAERRTEYLRIDILISLWLIYGLRRNPRNCSWESSSFPMLIEKTIEFDTSIWYSNQAWWFFLSILSNHQKYVRNLILNRFLSHWTFCMFSNFYRTDVGKSILPMKV